MMKLFKSKKGIDFMVVLLLAVFIGGVTMYLSVSQKVDDMQREIGETQIPLIKLNGDVEAYKVFVEHASRFALTQIKADVALPANQGLPGTACGRLNERGRPKVLRSPNIHGAIESSFNAKMNPYLSVYARRSGWNIPQDAFKVFVKQGKFVAIASKPTRINFGDDSVHVASYRPAAEIEVGHGFERYKDVILTLQGFADQCAYDDDPSACIHHSRDWSSDNDGDVFQFRTDVGGQQVCYELILPGQDARPPPQL